MESVIMLKWCFETTEELMDRIKRISEEMREFMMGQF